MTENSKTRVRELAEAARRRRTPDQVKTCEPKPKKVKPTKSGSSEHPYQGRLVGEQNISEKAVSQAQQKAAGIALSAKRGDTPKSKLRGASKEMADMSTKELEKYAGTKRKGLPKKVDETKSKSKLAEYRLVGIEGLPLDQAQDRLNTQAVELKKLIGQDGWTDFTKFKLRELYKEVEQYNAKSQTKLTWPQALPKPGAETTATKEPKVVQHDFSKIAASHGLNFEESAKSVYRVRARVRDPKTHMVETKTVRVKALTESAATERARQYFIQRGWQLSRKAGGIVVENINEAGIIGGLVGLGLGAKGAAYAGKHTPHGAGVGTYVKNFAKGAFDPRTYLPNKNKSPSSDSDLRSPSDSEYRHALKYVSKKYDGQNKVSGIGVNTSTGEINVQLLLPSGETVDVKVPALTGSVSEAGRYKVGSMFTPDERESPTADEGYFPHAIFIDDKLWITKPSREEALQAARAFLRKAQARGRKPKVSVRPSPGDK